MHGNYTGRPVFALPNRVFQIVYAAQRGFHPPENVTLAGSMFRRAKGGIPSWQAQCLLAGGPATLIEEAPGPFHPSLTFRPSDCAVVVAHDNDDEGGYYGAHGWHGMHGCVAKARQSCVRLPDEMPSRGGFILPEIIVLAESMFHRRCHDRLRCYSVLGFLQR